MLSSAGLVDHRILGNLRLCSTRGDADGQLTGTFGRRMATAAKGANDDESSTGGAGGWRRSLLTNSAVRQVAMTDACAGLRYLTGRRMIRGCAGNNLSGHALIYPPRLNRDHYGTGARRSDRVQQRAYQGAERVPASKHR